MAGRPASLSEVIRAGHDAFASELHTALPGEVIAYDPLTNTVFVRPMVKHALYRDDGERIFEQYPDIPFVPIIWPRGNGNLMVAGLAPGDTVLLVFAESSLAEWRTTGQLSEPEDARRHSLGWPVAIPGACPDTKPLSPLDAAELAAGAMLVGQDGGEGVAQMIFGGTVPGVRFGKLAVMPVALAPPLVAFAQAAATTAAAIGTADGAAATALSALLAYAEAVAVAMAVDAVPAVDAAGETADAAATTAETAAASSSAAATAAGAAATAAAAGGASTLVKSL